MQHGASLAQQRGRGVVATILLALVLGGALVGGLYWWSSRPTADVSQAPAETAASVATETQSASTGDPAQRAAAAMREKRMFAPTGDNAFELYLQLADAEPDNTQARNALGELFPYAVLYVEQRLAAGDADEAARVLGLMHRADAQAPALPRLDAAVVELRAQAAEQQRAEAARQSAAQNAPAPATSTPAAVAEQPPATSPASNATAPAPSAASERPPVAAASTPASAQAAAAPPVVQTESAPASTPPAPRSAPSPPAGLPAVVSTAQPRYPVMAQRRKLEGRVDLEFTVRPDGSVTDVRVLSSEPEGVFDREAVAAMQRWRFAPAATESRGRRAFDFKLD